ncbi:MAG: DUF6629 family protein [Phycisphaerae bacterium]|jgi:hypothetical protein
MCFSATASFIVAAGAGVIGIATIRSIKSPVELPAAAIPILFAVQQAAEGGLWLALGHAPDGPWPWILTQIYLSFALVIWPIYTPAAVMLMEEVPWRRWVMFGCGLWGVSISSFFLVQLLTLHNEGYISGSHILYRTNVEAPLFAGTVYLTACALALAMSSHRIVMAFGGVVFVAAVFTYFTVPDVFVSVWCFYAAAGSIFTFMHFRQRAMRRA